MILSVRLVRRVTVAALGILVLWAAGPVAAQTKTPGRTQLAMSFRVDVAMLRLLGGKEVSRLPFTLWVQATTPSTAANGSPSSGMHRLRLGVDVPVGAAPQVKVGSPQTGAVKIGAPNTDVNYRNIGTSIDTIVTLLDDGRYDVEINLQDTSIFPSGGEGKVAVRSADPLAFRTFSTNNHWPMRDGETLPFAIATDKVTGETVRVDVTLAVVK